METVVYVDVLAAVNFILNYLTLLCAARLAGLPLRRLRFAAAAAVGTVYAIAAVLPELGPLASVLGKAAAALVMAAVAYGFRPAGGLLRAWAIFLAVTFLFAGAVFAAALALGGGRYLGVRNGIVYINVSFWLIALTGIGAYGLLGLVFGPGRAKKIAERRAVDVKLAHGGKSVGFPALVDTGCAIRDPVTNRPVIVAEYGLARPVLPPGAERTEEWLKSGPFCALEKLSSAGLGKYFRLLSYNSLGQENGLLLAFRPDKTVIDGRDMSGTLVALSSVRLSGGGGFGALTGV